MMNIRVLRRSLLSVWMVTMVCAGLPVAIADEVGVSVASAATMKSVPLSLDGVANRGFVDAVPDDGAGGWTDQGPGLDLRVMESGTHTACGVNFTIMDAAKNGGKSCVALGRQSANKNTATEVTVPANGAVGKDLVLLHALSWRPSAEKECGRITVTYQDGTQQEISVHAVRDVAEWRHVRPGINGVVGWRSVAASGEVGLYLSRYEIREAPVASIRLSSVENRDWLVVAATIASQRVQNGIRPTTIVPSAEWRVLPSALDVEKNSALDLSARLDAPAGKYGRLIVRGESFVFEQKPEEPVRLCGVNLCFWDDQVFSKKFCETIADRFAAYGFNSIRLHAFDNAIIRQNQQSTTELDPESMDRFDYLLHCLKQRGMYTTIDLYTFRRFNAGEIEGTDINGKCLAHFKKLIPVNDSAMKNWEVFSKNLLTHTNPYTGMQWKDDPSVVTISLVNENTVFDWWFINPKIKAMYALMFEKWLEKTDPQWRSRGKTLNKMLFEPVGTRFLMDCYNDSYRKMKDTLRGWGVKAPLSDQNMFSTVPMAFMRTAYDYVDNHFYYDFPEFIVKDWVLPYGYSNISLIDTFLAPGVNTAAARLLGKPYTISEFNWSFPNRYRAEAGAMIASYARLQDWQGLYVYAFGGTEEELTTDAAISGTDPLQVSKDPIAMLSYRMMSFLFERGDVSPSKVVLPIVVGKSSIDDSSVTKYYPISAGRFALVGKVGSVVEGEEGIALPDGARQCLTIDRTAIPAGIKSLALDQSSSESALLQGAAKELELGDAVLDYERKFARSSTGELEMDGAARSFKAVTARSEALVLCQKGVLTGKALTIESATESVTVFAGSLDSLPLENSRRVLLLHLTDVKNSGMRFRDEGQTVLEEIGTLPRLVRRGQTTVRLACKGDAGLRIYGLDMAGKRIGEVLDKTFDGSSVRFVADTFAFSTPCLAYELVQEGR